MLVLLLALPSNPFTITLRRKSVEENVEAGAEQLNPDRTPEKYCERLLNLADMMSSAIKLSVLVPEAQMSAVNDLMAYIQREAAELQDMQTFGPEPFDIYIRPSDDVHSMVLQTNGEIVAYKPRTFIATDFSSITGAGIMFYDRRTRNRLQIYGFKFSAELL